MLNDVKDRIFVAILGASSGMLLTCSQWTSDFHSKVVFLIAGLGMSIFTLIMCLDEE